MPDGTSVVDSRSDPYAWALTQAALLRRDGALKSVDRDGLSEFLEEWAAEMLASVRSQMVNLLAHAAKVALSRNPGVAGHWRSECTEFHDQLVEAYRPSMRDKIDIVAIWRRAQRKVMASFDDHGEPRPQFSARCPVSVDELLDPELDLDRLVAAIKRA